MPITGTSLLVTAQRRQEAGPAKSQAVMNIKAHLYHQPREARNPGEGSTFEEGSLLTCKRLFMASAHRPKPAMPYVLCFGFEQAYEPNLAHCTKRCEL
jgi:hypothetical protein